MTATSAAAVQARFNRQLPTDTFLDDQDRIEVWDDDH